jgi:benzylsuccinate CoA-transferase BbsF subunit
LKVADFTWVAIGPITTKALADHGAIVVKIESETRPDPTRLSGPYKDNLRGLNRTFHFTNLNSSKLSTAINLSKPEGRELARRMIDWADVVVENYSAGTMKRLGLDYETLRQHRPDLIMLSTCLLGQTGPWASYSGGGSQGSAVAGFNAITGWPDRPPSVPANFYTDLVTARYSVAILAAAIFERRKSGLGQYIDLSQVEASMHFIEPLLLDQTVNGRTAPAAGLTSMTACPNGVYPAAGVERYVAISVETVQQWRALLSLVPLEQFRDPRYDSLNARRSAEQQIDAAIANLTVALSAGEVERRLVEAGVPASVVQRPSDLIRDEQLHSRGFFVTLPHPETGPSAYDGLVTHFSAKKEMLHKAAPCLGEDTHYVMSSLLGLAEDEVARYALAGAIT